MVRTQDELEAIRRRVLNVVGHALRTPVTTLCGLADELASRADDPVTRPELIAGVHRNARTVEQLLDDLLVASGVTTALPVQEPSAVDVGEVALRSWSSLGSAKPLTVHGGPVRAFVPATVAEGALRKLLENAASYGEGDIELRLGCKGGAVSAEVVSRGGLPTAEELELCDEPFFRGEHAVMTKPGLGIGLSVARALAEHAGGSVIVGIDGDRFVARVELPAA